MLQRVAEEIRRVVENDQGRPLVVSVMGQTGVGKSSLINALFDTNLDTDPVRPSTKIIQRRSIKGKLGHEVIFYDLPGIGESQQADLTYIKQYQEKLEESDVVIWAILADSRSFMYDYETFQKILDELDHNEKIRVMNKIIFVLTKVDLLTHPDQSARWILSYSGNDESIFQMDKNMEDFIKQKENYFQEVFISQFKDLIKGQTYYNGTFNVHIPNMTNRRKIVHYDGFIERQMCDEWINQHSKYRRVFERLYDKYRIIPCSARFHFNLDQLTLVIVDKLRVRSAGRFRGFLVKGTMNKVSFSKAKEYSNMIIFDAVRNQLHDLSKIGG